MFDRICLKTIDQTYHNPILSPLFNIHKIPTRLPQKTQLALSSTWSMPAVIDAHARERTQRRSRQYLSRALSPAYATPVQSRRAGWRQAERARVNSARINSRIKSIRYT